MARTLDSKTEKELKFAAEALADEYRNNKELTAFTAIDGDPFFTGSNDMFKISVYLRNKDDGFSDVYITENYSKIFNEFIWTEGNYACDCNRSLFLYDGWNHKDKCLDCNVGDNIIVIDKIIRTDNGEVLIEDI